MNPRFSLVCVLAQVHILFFVNFCHIVQLLSILKKEKPPTRWSVAGLLTGIAGGLFAAPTFCAGHPAPYILY